MSYQMELRTIAMSSHKEGTKEAGLPNAGGKYGECLDV
jgi:hypothetical protein